MQFKHHPFLIVISSPSGAGKSSLCKIITQQDSSVKLSVSVTTRKKRSEEIDGKDYYFISDTKYKKMLKNNQFIEHAHVLGNYYATPKKMVTDQLTKGNDVLFDIDGQGKKQLVKNFKKNHIITIFILPPSIKELYKRLKTRAQDSTKVIKDRMEMAKNEILYCDQGKDRYEYVLINDNLEKTAAKIKVIIDTLRIKNQDRQEIRSFISELADVAKTI